MVYGKVPPQAKELEVVVLGAIMLEKGAFDIVSEILHPECFYVDAHQRIFKAMRSLVIKNMPVDLLTVVEQLKIHEDLEKVGGAYYVTTLTNGVVSSANIEAHSRVVLQKFIQREIIRISGELIGDAYEESTDVFDLMEKAETALYEISTNHFKSDYSQLGAGVPQFLQNIEDLKKQDSSITGVPSGFKELDRVTHGWQPSDLIILAARPSVGKTAFSLNLAANAANNELKPTNVGLFTLEMSNQQLLKRVMSMESGIWMERLTNGRINDTSLLYQTGEKVSKMKIYVDDSGGLNMYELRAKARRMVNKHGVGLIIIDYLQLMSGESSRGGGNREQEISSISRGLKKLAKELNIPIIALSQLSREVEKRGKGQKVPQLSDLRESGAIEQDADIVMFLYRPPEDEVSEDAALADKGMAKIAKNRNGSLESFAFEVNNNIQRWSEIGTLEQKRWTRVVNEDPTSGLPNNSIVFPNNEDMPF